MRTMENIEYSFLIGELKKLIGERFEKIQELKKGKLSIKIGKERILCELGVRMNIAYLIESAENENNFIQKIRKEMKGYKLGDIFQHNNDRVIVFEFELHEEKKEMIFEMFGEGNVILVCNGKIITCYKREKWADREIKPGESYNFPKSNIVESLKEATSERYIISCMMRLPLGKKYAKEILGRVNIEEKTPGNELKKEEIEKIENEIKNMKKEFTPVGFYKEGKLIDYGLVEFEEHKTLEKRKFGSLSEVIDGYYKNITPEGKSEKMERLERRIEEQKKVLEELKKKEKEYREIGDKIYERYSEIEEILKNKKEVEIEI